MFIGFLMAIVAFVGSTTGSAVPPKAKHHAVRPPALMVKHTAERPMYVYRSKRNTIVISYKPASQKYAAGNRRSKVLAG